MSATTVELPQFLPVFFAAVDEDARDAMRMVAPDFRFSYLWSDERGPREFTGGLDEYNGYLDQRRPDGQQHHIDVGTRDGRVEVVLGHTSRRGERLGTFTFAVWLNEEGLAERLYSGRTLAFGKAEFAPPEGAETTRATVLPKFLEALDRDAKEVFPLLAPGMEFDLLWSDERGVNEFVGGLEEYHGYLAQREPEGQLHHLPVTARAGRAEVALGYTTRHGNELGTFTMFLESDEQDRVRRFFAGRSLAFSGIWS